MMRTFALLFCLTLSAWAACPNTGNGYSYCASITIDNTKVSGSANHTNFPVLIADTYDGTGGEPDLRVTGSGGNVQNSSGWDIRFETPAGVQLDHELEAYTSTTGAIVAWVEVPDLDYNDDTVIWIYYGKSGLGASEEDVEGTWDSNFKAVHHLKESSGTRYDSTSNNQDCTTATSITNVSSGKIGAADDFNGTTSVLACGTIDGTVTSNVTMEAWVNLDGQDIIANDSLVVVAIAQLTNSYVTHDLVVGDYVAAGDSRLVHASNNNTSWRERYSTSEIATSGWVHIAFTTDGTTTTFYINGSTDTGGTLTPYSNTSTYYLIGSRRSPSSSSMSFDGFIDEVRYSTTVRSGDWIATEYANQNSPTTFYAMGSEDAPPAGSSRRYAPVVIQ